jgi:hypothetical protein
MAVVEWSQLVRMLRDHPDYPSVHAGVSVDQALTIVFGPSESPSPPADSLEVVDGSELVIRKTRAGRVTSIEIV